VVVVDPFSLGYQSVIMVEGGEIMSTGSVVSIIVWYAFIFDSLSYIQATISAQMCGFSQLVTTFATTMIHEENILTDSASNTNSTQWLTHSSGPYSNVVTQHLLAIDAHTYVLPHEIRNTLSRGMARPDAQSISCFCSCMSMRGSSNIYCECH
jgi:hypothetical protein